MEREFNRLDAILFRLDLLKCSKCKFPDDYNEIQELIKGMLKNFEKFRITDSQYYRFLKQLLKSFRAKGKEDATDVEAMQDVMREDFKRVQERLIDWKNYLEKEFKLEPI